MSKSTKVVLIGSARIDENGKANNGKPGDQKQISNSDFKGEVSQQEFYVSNKGWIILRPKNRNIAFNIATKMITACNNANIGYAQTGNPGRYGILKEGVGSKVKTNCDCSSLVRDCIKEATGKDPGDFNTANEVSVLMKTDLFEKLEYEAGMNLFTGDILVTKTKGHTVIVTQGDYKKSNDEIAIEVIRGLWGEGFDRRKRLKEEGYDPDKIQTIVNTMLSMNK